MASTVDSHHLKYVPSEFKYNYDPAALSCDSFPVVDFSALSAADPDQRSKAIRDISRACEEWGFFIVENHGVGEELLKEAFKGVKEFFSLGVDEKKQYAGKSGVDPLNYVGFDMNDIRNQECTYWREKLWLDVHPTFHCPHKPQSLRQVMMEYCKRSREICRKVMEAISEGLQLEHQYVDQVLGLESSYEFVIANYYPPCPRPDQAIGIIPHTDAALFTLLIHNGVPGLQIQHQGHWFDVHSPSNSIFVNVSDQLEIFTNGRYKSLNHRVVVNEERERMSIAMEYCPSKEAIISPDASFVEKDGRAMYRSIKFGDYLNGIINNSDFLSSYRQ